MKSVKRTVVIFDASFLRIIPTDCTFLTNNINVVLFSNIYFPTCFGLNKSSSERFNHTGKQNYINIYIYIHHLQTCCTFLLAFISFPLFSFTCKLLFVRWEFTDFLLYIFLALDLYLLYIIQTNDNFMTNNVYVLPQYSLNFHKYFGVLGQSGENSFSLL